MHGPAGPVQGAGGGCSRRTRGGAHPTYFRGFGGEGLRDGGRYKGGQGQSDGSMK